MSAEGQDGTTSWASRNPDKSTIQPRPRTKKTISSAERLSRKQRTEAKKVAKASLEQDLDVYEAECEARIAVLAKAHDKTPEYIRKIVTNSSLATATRQPTLANAIIHYKTLEVNGDRQEGDRLSLAEIRQLAKDDPELQNLSPERERELIDLLLEHRATKATGARVSNSAAANDVRTTINRISDDIANLHERTGVYAFAMFARGHIHDNYAPAVVSAEDTLDFFSEVLRISSSDVVTKLEQWACARNKRKVSVETIRTLRADCTQLIGFGLCTILNKKVVAMNYTNYDTAIVLKYKVELVGWPSHIAFGNPSNISTVGDMRTLRNALQIGSCKWVTQTARQQAAHAERMEAAQEAGVTVGKPRKPRSDKGKKRVRRNATAMEKDEAEEVPRKKKRVSATKSRDAAKRQIPPQFKSREIISDSDSASSSDSSSESDD